MDDDNNNQDHASLNVPPRADQAAAADVIRGDIDRIYNGDTAPHAEAEKEIIAETQQQAVATPSEQSPADNTQIVHQHVAEGWKRYHSSWQSYYQQYYERYYLNHLQNLASTSHPPAVEPAAKPGVIGSAETLESEQAISELRDKLLESVKDRAEVVRGSRHFAPIITALIFALVFIFLQYNRFFFATVDAYVSPGSIDPQNIIVSPESSVAVNGDPKLIIPKINVEAPVVYGVNSADVNAIENSLHNGVVNYPITGASSVPGQNGATVILGHSSNDVFDSGSYKFVFVQLNKLDKGDTFFINFQGVRYTYEVTDKTIISPQDVGKVKGNPSKPTAILITCDPPGTAINRLLIFADQISPDPSKAAAPSTQAPATTNIAGNSPTLVERLFGVN